MENMEKKDSQKVLNGNTRQLDALTKCYTMYTMNLAAYEVRSWRKEARQTQEQHR